MARYELLIDGRRRWRAKSESELREWIRDYRDAHAEDDPEASHVQIRKLSPWSWLTGGAIVPVTAFVDA